jgi:polyphosphate kinase 2 (PPK2 family)
LLNHEQMPPELVTENIWKERFEDINAYERYLTRNGIVIRKFFLNLSRKEQKRRFLARLEQPEKNWKFSDADVREREFWDDYMRAYEEMIANTATEHAPWYVVPADNKWFTRVVVSAAVVDTLEKLHLSYPSLDPDKEKRLQAARKYLSKKGT